MLPLIFFIDETFCDRKGTLPLEPVKMTLGIFNRKTRHDISSWRTLGFLSDFKLTVNEIKSKTIYQGSQKATDYHRMLSYIFSDIVNVQEKGGFNWSLGYKG